MSDQWCPIGSFNLHSMNHERTECIWCGPNKLAWKPGRWVDQGNGTSAWAAPVTATCVECNRTFVPDAALLAVLPWPETEGACSPMCNIFLHLTRPECREAVTG